MNRKLFSTILCSSFILNMSPNILVHSMESANYLHESENISVNDDIDIDINIINDISDIDYFDNSKVVLDKLHKLNNILELENSLLRIELKPGQNIYMIGDIHCDIFSLDFVKKFIYQHPNDKFIFLGDYVDRGYFGTEVFIGLANLKINNRDRVYLLRGNHETEFATQRYGFYEELEAKFSNDFKNVYNEFNETFNKLPLAAEINCGSKKIFCVHGGICPSIDGDTLKLKDLENLPKEQPKINSIAYNLLWSDPEDISESFIKNVSRGAGYIFGKSAVKDFLNKNNLNYIVRAHQPVMEGFEEKFDGMLRTVFSAPRYCGYMNNKGAILKFDNLTKTFREIKFDASSDDCCSYTQVH